MKRHALVVLAFALFSTGTSAQLAVFDAGNFVQNSLTAARTLQEVNNQIKQLANEAQMLVNDARNLATLPYDIVWQLKSTLALTNQLIAQAQGIGFQISQTNVAFNRFYPPTYYSSSGANMLADSKQRWWHSFLSLQTTVAMQSQAAQNLASDENALATLVSQSQGAIGIVQAAQATNQLLALHSRQLIQEQQLRLTQDRSAAIERARMVIGEERAREIRRRFEGNGAVYTAQPVNFYGF